MRRKEAASSTLHSWPSGVGWRKEEDAFLSPLAQNQVVALAWTRASFPPSLVRSFVSSVVSPPGQQKEERERRFSSFPPFLPRSVIITALLVKKEWGGGQLSFLFLVSGGVHRRCSTLNYK